MELHKQSYNIILQDVYSGDYDKLIDNIHRHTELCGRVCYKSEHRISEGTADRFFKGLMDRNHGAMLEHGSVYLKIPRSDTSGIYDAIVDADFTRFGFNYKPLVLSRNRNDNFISTNFRYLFDISKLINEGSDYHHRIADYIVPFDPQWHELRMTVKFDTNRQIAQSFTRHRKDSFAMESTRYVNYSKEQFGSHLNFILPCWLYDKINFGTYTWDDLNKYDGDARIFMKSCLEDEENYLALVQKFGWHPEQAATTLGLDTKSELYVTGFIADWAHFFNLRAMDTTGKAHPQAKELAEPLMKQVMALGFYDEYLNFDTEHMNLGRERYERIYDFVNRYHRRYS